MLMIPGALRVPELLDTIEVEMPGVERLPATNELSGRSFLHDGRELLFLAVTMSIHADRPTVVFVDPVSNIVWSRPLGPAGQSVVLLDFLKVQS